MVQVTSGLPCCTPDDVDDALDLVHHLLDRSREFREAIGIVAEDLHLDRLRIAFEVAEHVLQQLDELDLDERGGLVDAFAHVADDFLRRTTPLTSRLEAHEDVAGVLRGREQTKL